MSSNQFIVEFENVSKIYTLEKSNTHNEIIKFYALKNVSFKIEKGAIVGILGTNGSGKSTLAKIISGIIVPDEGKVKINGEASLIAIKSGFNNQLSGIENIELKGALLGFNKEKIEKIKELVIEFSELGDYIYQPVKSYSSGMKSRLGFSISINLDPEILVIDEALSVGDKAFNQKCYDKIIELKEKGKTIFFVSHSINELMKYCTKGLWIENGEFKCYDDIDKVADMYEKYINDYNSKTADEKKQFKKNVFKNRTIKIKKKQKYSKLSDLIKGFIIKKIKILFSR